MGLGAGKSSCQETTKLSPFEVVYGRLPTTKEETYFPRLPDPIAIGQRARTRKMRKEAVAATKRAQVKQSVYYLLSYEDYNRRRL